MNIDDNNINDPQLDSLLPTAGEQDIIRCAFARREAASADIDAEWRRLSRITRRRSRLRLGFIAAAVAAACLAAVVVLNLPHAAGEGQVAVIRHMDMRPDISLTDAVGRAYDVDTAGVTFAGKQPSGTHATMMSMATPRGRDCRLTLSDGTRVWLNGESELRFPSEFSGARREVWLRGEAFFEVTKDPQHPFVVTSDYYSATVLGTSFDARAYSPADASVTLVEGSVRVSPAGSTSALVVTPGRMVTFGAAGMMNMSEVDVYPCLQRKEGYFYFEQASMLDIMIELGRWYNKTVVFEDTAAMNTMLHFVASRSDSLATVLGHIAELDNVEIEYTDEDITISRAE